MGYVTPANVGISDNRAAHIARDSPEPGTDYKTPYGTDIRMADDAVVILVDNNNNGADGRRLSIKINRNGEVIDYIHLSAIYVSVGARVKRGQTGVARSGASGLGRDWYYGSHVHVTRRAHTGLPYSHTLDFEKAVGALVSNSSKFPARAKYGASWVGLGQQLLNILGHKLSVDKKDGAKTQAAVKHEQGAASGNRYGTLVRDGILGLNTITYLWWAVDKWYRKGWNDTRYIKLVQGSLNVLGHGLKVDGDRGAKTIAAIKHEQGAAKGNGYGTLTVDGLPGFQTMKYVMWAIAKWRLPWR